MIIKEIRDEDFVNYKKASMFIGFPTCTWKCEKECGKKVCQNGTLATTKNIEVDMKKIVDRYINNNITNAITIGGLEPFDTYSQLYEFIKLLRLQTDDDVVIYTGYYKHEIEYQVIDLSQFKNIIIKYGRFIPDQKPHFDKVLGVNLASDNQYAERVS